MKKILYLIILIGLANVAKSQDTLFLNNGDIIIGKIVKIDSTEITFDKIKKNNKISTKFYDKEEIFSFKTKDSTSILYSRFNNNEYDFSEKEMQYFVLGQQDAKKYYKNPYISYGGFASGLAGGLLVDFYGTGLLIPALYSTIKGGVSCKFTDIPENKKPLLNEPYYKLGYKNSASRIRTIKSIKSGVLGVVTMVAIRIALQSIK